MAGRHGKGMPGLAGARAAVGRRGVSGGVPACLTTPAPPWAAVPQCANAAAVSFTGRPSRGPPRARTSADERTWTPVLPSRPRPARAEACCQLGPGGRWRSCSCSTATPPPGHPPARPSRRRRRNYNTIIPISHYFFAQTLSPMARNDQTWLQLQPGGAAQRRSQRDGQLGEQRLQLVQRRWRGQYGLRRGCAVAAPRPEREAAQRGGRKNRAFC